VEDIMASPNIPAPTGDAGRLSFRPVPFPLPPVPRLKDDFTRAEVLAILSAFAWLLIEGADDDVPRDLTGDWAIIRDTLLYPRAEALRAEIAARPEFYVDDRATLDAAAARDAWDAYARWRAIEDLTA
jgi:hypothetical protein